MTFTGIVGSDNDYVIHSFINGLKKHGYTRFRLQDYRNIPYTNTKEYFELTNNIKDDVCIGWSGCQLESFQSLGENVIIFEHPCFGHTYQKPASWISAGWNGLGRRGTFCNTNSNSFRWDEHFSFFKNEKLKDWTGGEFVLLLAQPDRGQSLIFYEQELKAKTDYNKIIRKIKEKTDLPIRVKHHPKEINSNIWNIPSDIKVIDSHVSVYDAIKNAKVCVTINSNSVVESVLGGTPAITLDRGSMAWDITEHNFDKIETPPLPDREQWIYDITYCQWKLEEFNNGTAWDHLRQIYN